MKRVELIWRDAHGGDKGWRSRKKTIKAHKPATMRTVGYLLKDDEIGVTLVFSRSQGGKTVGEYLFVAAPMVVSVKELYEHD